MKTLPFKVIPLKDAGATASRINKELGPVLTLANQAVAGTLASTANTVAKAKHIMKIAADVGDMLQPYTPCRSGCGACCRQSVAITRLEAFIISKDTGYRVHPTSDNPLVYANSNPSEKYKGKPCTFLQADMSCAIYEHRPLICRTHHSIEDTAAPCDPEGGGHSLVDLMGISTALLALDFRGIADIREYFPSKEK